MRRIIPLALLALVLLAGCNGLKTGETAAELEAPAVNATQLELEGDNLAQSGRLEEAFVKYSHILSAYPENNKVRLKKGNILLRRNLADQALNEFLLLLGADPHSEFASYAHLGAGQALFMAGLSVQASEHFRRALEADPNLWKAHAYMGIVHNREQEYEAAEKDFLAALAVRPNSPELLNDLGLTYAMTSRYDLAVAMYRRALAAGAPPEKVSNNLGLALYRLGRYNEALEALRLGPTKEDLARAYNNLGYCFLLDGDNERAVEFLEKAMEAHPAFYVHAHENLTRAKTAMTLQEAVGGDIQIPNQRYTLLLGEYENRDQARSQQETLAQLGLDTRVVQALPPAGKPSATPQIQVVKGSFESLEQAKEERLRLVREYGLAEISVQPL